MNVRGTGSPGQKSVLLIIALAMILPQTSRAFEKSLRIGVNGGYGASARREDTPPGTIHGTAFGIFLVYGISSSWGISIESNLDWHSPSRIYKRGVVPASDPTGPQDSELGHVGDYDVTRSYLSGITLSAVYAIDVSDIFPFFLLGVTGVRQDRIIEREIENGLLIEYQGAYALGLRFGIGFDYMLLKSLGLGAVLSSDIFLTDATDFKGRLTVLARITLVFDVSNFGKRGQGG